MMGDNPDNIRAEIEQKTSVSEINGKVISLVDSTSAIISDKEKVSLKEVKQWLLII